MLVSPRLVFIGLREISLWLPLRYSSYSYSSLPASCIYTSTHTQWFAVNLVLTRCQRQCQLSSNARLRAKNSRGTVTTHVSSLHLVILGAGCRTRVKRKARHYASQPGQRCVPPSHKVISSLSIVRVAEIGGIVVT